MKLTGDQQIIRQVIQKAWEDESFKKQLVENPAYAIERVTGQPLNLNGKILKVSDQTDPAIVFINIPAAKAAMDDIELTEDQLDRVSGGDDLDGGLFPTTRGNG